MSINKRNDWLYKEIRERNTRKGINEIFRLHGVDLPLVSNEKPPFTIKKGRLLKSGPTFHVYRPHFWTKIVNKIKDISSYFKTRCARRKAIKSFLGGS